MAAVSMSLGAAIDFADGDSAWQNKLRRLAGKPHQKADSLSAFLTDNSFLDNTVSAGAGESGEELHVYFGPRYNLGNIYTHGDFTDTIAVDLPFTADNVNDALDSIAKMQQSRGYYYMAVVPERYEKRDSLINIYVQTVLGPRVSVSGLELTGLKKTDYDFVRRLIDIDEGEALSKENLEQSRRSLSRLDFVSLAGDPEIIPEAGYETARIRYNFAEKQQFYFEGAAGYIPEDDGYYVWYLDTRGRNLFGRGQKAGLLADSREKYKSIFRVYYGQPLFLLGTGDVMLQVQTRDYRDQFYEFGLSANYGLMIKGGFILNTELGWKNVEPSQESQRSFRVYEVGVGVRTGMIEAYRGAPASLALDWTVKYSGRRYKQNGDSVSLERAVFNDTRAELRAGSTAPLYGLAYGYLSVAISDIETSEKPLPVSELFLFGGPGSLRGYRNDQFAARRMGLFTSELRIFYSRNDYIYPFADGAYFQRYRLDQDGGLIEDDDFELGYGFGVSLSSTTSRLRIEFAWNEEAKLSEPRLNVSFTGQF